MELYSSNHGKITKAAIGGKAFNLYRLREWGFRVPDFVVIPQSILLDIIPNEFIQNEDVKSIVQVIKNHHFKESFLQEILSHFKNNNKTFFAVRSSAIDEDGNDFSFAGQFETCLYVKPGNLADSIKKVWLSAFSKRVLSYRKKHGLGNHFGIAVIIQEMIDPEVSGVGFGVNPILGDREEKVISAVFGLGEGLVSGALDADTFFIKNNSGKNIPKDSELTKIYSIEKQIAEKKHAQVQSENGGIKMIGIEKTRQHLPCLSDARLMELANILEKLQAETGKPQDIEFVVAKQKIHLLQTRPVTNLDKVADKKGEYILWDNSNIIESYPGVTTPLTFSFIIKVYEAVYRQLIKLFGVSDGVIAANADTFSNTLGLLNGRVYYNLLSWYKMLALLPGYSLNAEFMETMMGVKERFELPEGEKISRTKAWFQIIVMVFSMIKSLVTLPKERRKFIAQLDEIIAAYKEIDFSKKRPDELMRLYMDFENILLVKWKAPLVNDFFSMIYFGILKKLTSKLKISKNPNIHNDLLCGSKDIISTEPIHQSLEIATLILKNKAAKQLFLEEDPQTIWGILKTNKFPEVKRVFDAYLTRFGERCVGELKLETTSYNQDPTLFVKIIKSYIKQGTTIHSTNPDIEKMLRTKAEKAISAKLKNKPLKFWFFTYILNKTRSLVSSRENLRYERTRAFGMVRAIFTAIGKKFFAEGIIENPRDIFYLTKEEIFAFIQGTSVNANLKKLITCRKEEFEGFAKMNPPSERIPTYGIVNHANDFYSKEKTQIIEGDLEGIGCCPGSVKGKVRVVGNPYEIDGLNGDILVTTNTDPGWVVLFPTASAIIVERGSLLSHSAIVSREMGIPCIVGVTGLLQTLKGGDMIEMDGATGRIKILDKSNNKQTNRQVNLFSG